MSLRPWRADDASALARCANDRRIWLNMRDAFPHPYGREDAERFIAKATVMSPRTYFAIEVDGHVAGGIGHTLHMDVERIGAAVGYRLGVDFWGRGSTRFRSRRIPHRLACSQSAATGAKGP